MEWDNTKGSKHTPFTPTSTPEVRSKCKSTAWIQQLLEQPLENDGQLYQMPWTDLNQSMWRQSSCLMIKHNKWRLVLPFTVQVCSEPIRLDRTAWKQLTKILVKIFNSVFNIIKGQKLPIPFTLLLFLHSNDHTPGEALRYKSLIHPVVINQFQ